MSRLILDLNEAIEAEADARGKRALIRKLRRALKEA